MGSCIPTLKFSMEEYLAIDAVYNNVPFLRDGGGGPKFRDCEVSLFKTQSYLQSTFILSELLGKKFSQPLKGGKASCCYVYESRALSCHMSDTQQ